ncbi:hypothetical protein NUKP79_46910 [Klebsiella quasipneumoniae]|nr:hypothetical protein NUKP79_46910 [Klebsiella quasipneumoniae]
MFAGKKSAQIREILISESAWEEMTCLFAPSLNHWGFIGAGKEAPSKDYLTKIIADLKRLPAKRGAVGKP